MLKPGSRILLLTTQLLIKLASHQKHTSAQENSELYGAFFPSVLSQAFKEPC